MIHLPFDLRYQNQPIQFIYIFNINPQSHHYIYSIHSIM
jgi:hypothetical protein